MNMRILVSVVASTAFAAVTAMSVTAVRAELDLDHARAKIAEHSKAPVFEPPGPPFDAKSCMAGKRVMTIPVSSANPFTKNIALAMAEVGKEVGFEVVEWENQARLDQWVQGVEFAVNEKFDLIDMLGGTNPAALVPQVEAARKAGVIVKTSHLYDLSQTPHPGVNGAVPVDYSGVGRLLADWVIAKSEGQANVLIIGSDEVVPTEPFVRGITDELTERCGEGCKWSYINAPVPEWATKIQPSVQASLIGDPSINYIIPIYDSMSQFVVPAVTITGRKGDVKIATFNGTPFVIDLVQRGEVEMDIGESLGWISRSIMDSHMRSLCGLQEPDELMVPFYIFDEKNAADAGTPADYDRGYGDLHIAGFRKLWGLE